jgi:N-acetylmuramoyl-L-alanine amidase
MLTTIYQRLSQLLLFAALIAAPSITLAASTIEDVRLWRAPDHTRVVLDLSAPAQHSLLTLSNPDRIVIDIEQATLQADLTAIDLHNSPITTIRSGRRNSDDLRIVLDINAKVKPNSFLLAAQEEFSDRLVIDLYDQQATSSKVTKTVAQQADQRRDIIIAIDAGHGGEDPGASGPGGLREKHLVLAIAKQLNEQLKQARGYSPVMVRTGDYYVGLDQRRAIARDAQADMLVSIHADAFTKPSAHGGSVYALSQRGATSATAQFLANEANSSDLIGGVTLSDKDDMLAGVLMDLSMNHSMSASLQVGDHVLRAMDNIAHLHSRKVEQASFIVLKSPDIPSILVETGFISNPTEARRLNTANYQRDMARAIATGIKAYFADSPPIGTLIAAEKRQPAQQYTVARGDTLSGIAQRYKVSIASIREANGLSSSVIKTGQTIMIPN